MENKKNLKLIFILLVITFITPSIIYLISGRKILNLLSNFTFFFMKTSNSITPIKIISAICFVGLFVAISIVYYLIIKNYKKIFTSDKDIIKFITIISILFFIMLPITSTDIFYYIGTGWSEAKWRS